MSLKTALKPIFLIILVAGTLYFVFLLIYGGRAGYFRQTSDISGDSGHPTNTQPPLGEQLHALNVNPGNGNNQGQGRNAEQMFQQVQQQLSQLQQQLIQQQQQSDQREQKVQKQVQQMQQQLQQHQQQPQQQPNGAQLIFPAVQNAGNNLPAQVNNNNNPPQVNPNNQQTTNQGQRPLVNGLHPDVNVVPSVPDEGFVLPYKDCVPLPMSPKNGVMICIHPIQDDVWVSGEIKKNKLWEQNLIVQMQKVLESDTRLSVLDLGCNIGVYTLFAAAMGREVVSVEMLITNVNLVQTSLQLSGLSKSVTLINNAVFSDHRTLGARFVATNIGGTSLNVHETVDNNKGTVLVKTICLDDLIPLLAGKSLFVKMDIENSEHEALACAHKLFNEVDIKVVQMEWMNKIPEDGDQILEFMKLHKYAISRSPFKYEPVPVMGGDLYFLKKSTFSIP